MHCRQWNGKPYYSLDCYLKQQFGEKLYKIAEKKAETKPSPAATKPAETKAAAPAVKPAETKAPAPAAKPAAKKHTGSKKHGK